MNIEGFSNIPHCLAFLDYLCVSLCIDGFFSFSVHFARTAGAFARFSG